MANIKIIYATVTKHSKKLAEAIGKALEIPALNIVDKPVLKDVDLLFIVGGIYGGVGSPKLIEYVKTIETGSVKQVALVTSSLSKRFKQTDVSQIMIEKGANIIDEFICRGALLFLYFRHPNKQEVQEAVDFATQIVQKLN